MVLTQDLSPDCRETGTMLELSQRLPHLQVWQWHWRVQTSGAETAGASLTLSSGGLHVVSAASWLRAAEFIISWLLRAPAAYVLSQRTKWKLYYFLRPSLESHIGLLLLCIHRSPPKKSTQIQREGTEMPSLDLG